MQDSETGYTLYADAPEPTDAELHAQYLDQLEQTAPPIAWDDFCSCEDDNRFVPRDRNCNGCEKDNRFNDRKGAGSVTPTRRAA